MVGTGNDIAVANDRSRAHASLYRPRPYNVIVSATTPLYSENLTGLRYAHLLFRNTHAVSDVKPMSVDFLRSSNAWINSWVRIRSPKRYPERESLTSAVWKLASVIPIAFDRN